jgi:hypothetical protein
MIYFNADAGVRSWPTQQPGQAAHSDARNDDQVVIRTDDPAVMESRVNAEGQRQAGLAQPRGLAGIQISGSGQGGQFVVFMLFTRDRAAGGAAEDMEFAVDDGAGIRCFFFKGETEAELRKQMDQAIARADAFGGIDATWKGQEIAGSSFGASQMGMLISYFPNPQ